VLGLVNVNRIFAIIDQWFFFMISIFAFISNQINQPYIVFARH